MVDRAVPAGEDDAGGVAEVEGFHGRRGRLPLALREATSAPAFSGGGVAGSGREGRLAVSETAPERRAGSSASRRRVAERREIGRAHV